MLTFYGLMGQRVFLVASSEDFVDAVPHMNSIDGACTFIECEDGECA